ncbi:hypothetical protein SeMB42_g05305 [Synchytrium endobioticum]|nr:hypothetical protein SeMB42_g05305 [Synchytrium endobioticum]
MADRVNPAILIRNALALDQPQKAVDIWTTHVQSDSSRQDLLSSDDYADLILAFIAKSSSFRQSSLDVVGGKRKKLLKPVLDAVQGNNIAKTPKLQAAMLRAEGLVELGPIVRKASSFSKDTLDPLVGRVIFESLATLGRHEGASLFLEKLCKSLPRDRRLMYEIFALGAYHNISCVDEPLQRLLDSLQNSYSPSLERNKSLMQFYANFGRITPVSKYFSEVKKSHHIKADSECYDAIIKTHVTRNQLGDAVDSYSEMRNRGLEALDSTYTHLINGHAAAKDMAGAVRFFYKKQSVPGYKPSASVCAALVAAYVSNGELEVAWRTLKMCIDIYKVRFRPNDFVELARIHADKHTHMLRDCWTWAQIKDEMRRGALAEVLIHAMMQLDTAEGARGVLRLGSDLEKELGVKMTTGIRVVMASAHAYLGKVAEAEKIIRSIPVRHRQPYNLILKALASQKDVDGMKRIRGIMSSNDVEADNDTYEYLLVGADTSNIGSLIEEVHASGWFPSREKHPATYELLDTQKHILLHFNRSRQ